MASRSQQSKPGENSSSNIPRSSSASTQKPFVAGFSADAMEQLLSAFAMDGKRVINHSDAQHAQLQKELISLRESVGEISKILALHNHPELAAVKLSDLQKILALQASPPGPRRRAHFLTRTPRSNTAEDDTDRTSNPDETGEESSSALSDGADDAVSWASTLPSLRKHGLHVRNRPDAQRNYERARVGILSRIGILDLVFFVIIILMAGYIRHVVNSIEPEEYEHKLSEFCSSITEKQKFSSYSPLSILSSATTTIGPSTRT